MAVNYVGDNGPDGVCVGTGATELVGFHGATPSDQRAVSSLATGATIATTVAAVQELISLLQEKGLMASS